MTPKIEWVKPASCNQCGAVGRVARLTVGTGYVAVQLCAACAERLRAELLPPEYRDAAQRGAWMGAR